MNEPVVNPQKPTRRPALIAGVVVISLAAVLTLAAAGYLFAFKDRVFPGVTVNGLALGGLTKEEADAKLNAAITIYENSGLNFTYGKKTEKIDATQLPDGNADAAHQILDIDEDSGISDAFSIGRTGNLLTCFRQAMTALQGRAKITLAYTLDAAGFKDALRKIWSTEETPVHDARLVINMSGDTLASVQTVPDQAGFEFDYDRAVSDIKSKIISFDSSPVELQPARTNPAINQAAALNAKALVPQALSLAPLPLAADNLQWTLTARNLASMLEVYIKNDGTASLRISQDAATKYFQQLAGEYDIAPANTQYEIDQATQKMTIFKAGNNGRKIDITQSIADLQTALAKQLAGADGKTGYNLTATADKSQVVSQSAADLGIKEVIGVGQSDFSGSSATRIKNVRHGSDKLNGVLIAPDAEFSALGILEPVTIADGYFPEQIILGDKIEPGVGGGLCQIGTTLFRMAMNTGLPITERQNHSLVVHYYSDPTNGNPGTDATLYGPHPDLRFINNTGHWMLLTTDMNVKTKKLTYTLWGTADGRHGSYTPPQVANWIAAPTDIQQVEDPTLPVGLQKCQNAFRGANTSFTYTIVNPDGSITEKIFNSHYRSLPKICSNGTGVPGTVLPGGGTVPPLPAGMKPIPTGVPVTTPVTTPATSSNVNLPTEAAVGN